MSLVARQDGTVTEKRVGAVLGDAERQALQDIAHFIGADGLAELAHQPVHGQQDGRRRWDGLALVREAADQADAGREFLQQLDGSRQAAHGVGRVLRLFEAHGSVGAEFQRRGSTAHTGGIEAGAFEYDAGSARGDGAIHSADHAGERDCAFSVGDHKVGGLQREILLVERQEIFAFAGTADEDGIVVEQVAIEGVHGLRQFGHDEVGHVHDVVDRVQTDGGEPVLQPEGRGLHGDIVEDQRAVPRAEIQVFDGHFNRRGSGGHERRLHRIAKRLALYGGDFARHAVVSPEVRTVGDGFVVDLDDAIRSAAGEATSQFAC